MTEEQLEGSRAKMKVAMAQPAMLEANKKQKAKYRRNRTPQQAATDQAANRDRYHRQPYRWDILSEREQDAIDQCCQYNRGHVWDVLTDAEKEMVQLPEEEENAETRRQRSVREWLQMPDEEREAHIAQVQQQQQERQVQEQVPVNLEQGANQQNQAQPARRTVRRGRATNQQFWNGLDTERKQELKAKMFEHNRKVRKANRVQEEWLDYMRRRIAKYDWECPTNRAMNLVNSDKKIFDRVEDDPFRAVTLYHLNSGIASFRGLQTEDVDKVVEEIEREEMTPQQKLDMTKEFMAAHSFGLDDNLGSCACCGIRTSGAKAAKGRRVPLAVLDMLELTEEHCQVFNGSQDDARKFFCAVPTNMEATEYANIDVRDIFSWYHSEQLQRRFYLHPELVELDDAGCEVAYLCQSCCKATNADQGLPKNSIAAGVDFGYFARVGLEYPNLHEMAIISKMRNYVGYAKLKENSGPNANFTLNRLSAHTVLFADDSTGVVARCWDEGHMEECIKLQLICPDGKKDRLIQKTLGDSRILGRAYVVYQWLKVLETINPCYSSKEHLQIPPYANFRDALERVRQMRSATSTT